MKIPGWAFALVGIAVYIVTAYAPFEKSPKILFTVIAALLIIYGIGSIALESLAKKKETEKLQTNQKKTNANFLAQNVYQQQQQAYAKQMQAQQQQRAPQPQARVGAGAMGFCSVCGAIARADDNFCGKCGSRLR